MLREQATIRPVALAAAFVLLLVLYAARPAAAQPGQTAPLPPIAAQPGQTAPLPPIAAQPDGSTETLPPAPPERGWYGWQILVADGLALMGGTLLAEVSDLEGERGFGDQVSMTWALGMFGSMALHTAHRRPLRGLAGTAPRLIIPPVASLLGIAGHCVATEIGNGCAGRGARWGFAVGVGTAALVNALLLARLERNDRSQGWYGSSMLILDVAGLGLGLLALARPEQEQEGDPMHPALVLGSGHYLVSIFGAPWVHAAHGHRLRALGSFGLRALGPGLLTAAGVTGYCAASGGSNGCSDRGAAFGFTLGSLLAATIDVAVLSWDEHRTPSRAWSPRMVPYIAPGAGGGVQAGIFVDL